MTGGRRTGTNWEPRTQQGRAELGGRAELLGIRERMREKGDEIQKGPIDTHFFESVPRAKFPPLLSCFALGLSLISIYGI